MGIFDSLFGSDPQATTSTTPTLLPQQQDALTEAINAILGKGNLTASGAYTKYGGSYTAPTSNLENLSLSALEQRTINEATGGPGSTRANQMELDKIIKSGGSPVDINDYFTKTVEEPTLKSFSDKILPALQSTFSGSAAFGSDKLRQQQLLTNDLTKNLSSARAGVAYQSQNDALNRVMQALGLSTGASSAATGNLTASLGAGSVPRSVVQNDLTAQYQEFLRGQGAGTNDIQQLLALLGVKPFTSSTVVTPGSQGLVGGLAGAVTQGLMRGGTMGNLGGGLSSFFGLGGGAGDVGALMDVAGLLIP